MPLVKPRSFVVLLLTWTALACRCSWRWHVQVAAASDERKLDVGLSLVVHEDVVGGRGYLEGVAPQAADLFLILWLAGPQKVLNVL